jgi:rhodanese-related sulfurtransferase
MTLITVQNAVALASTGAITLLDVRDLAEVRASGQALGALHIPMAVLAIKVDPKSPDFDARITAGKPVAIYCAAGGRAGMAAATLKRFGFDAHNIGGFGDWVSAGGPVSR